MNRFDSNEAVRGAALMGVLVLFPALVHAESALTPALHWLDASGEVMEVGWETRSHWIWHQDGKQGALRLRVDVALPEQYTSFESDDPRVQFAEGHLILSVESPVSTFPIQGGQSGGLMVAFERMRTTFVATASCQRDGIDVQGEHGPFFVGIHCVSKGDELEVFLAVPPGFEAPPSVGLDRTGKRTRAEFQVADTNEPGRVYRYQVTREAGRPPSPIRVEESPRPAPGAKVSRPLKTKEIVSEEYAWRFGVGLMFQGLLGDGGGAINLGADFRAVYRPAQIERARFEIEAALPLSPLVTRVLRWPGSGVYHAAGQWVGPSILKPNETQTLRFTGGLTTRWWVFEPGAWDHLVGVGPRVGLITVWLWRSGKQGIVLRVNGSVPISWAPSQWMPAIVGDTSVSVYSMNVWNQQRMDIELRTTVEALLPPVSSRPSYLLGTVALGMRTWF